MASLLDEWAREETTTATTAGLDAYGRGAGGGGDNLLLGDEDFDDDDEFDDGIDFGGDDDETDGVLVGGTAGSSRRQQQQSDMFSLDVVEREVARGRGAVTAVAASADAVVVVTSRAYLLRYDVASGGPPVEVELVPASARSFSSSEPKRGLGGGGGGAASSSSSSPSSPAATGVWLDPATGSHAVVAVDRGPNGSSEALYVHARWRKPRALSLALGVGGGSDAAAAPSSSASSARLSAAAFDDASVTEGNTGPVLVATSAGVLSSFSFDERDKRETSSGKLYSFGGGNTKKQGWGPVGGVALARVGGGTKRVALVATAERLFVFSAQLPTPRHQGGSSQGESGLEPLFSMCSPDPADLTNFLGAAAAAASALGSSSSSPAPLSAVDVEGAGGVALVAPLPGGPFDRFVWLSRAGLVSGSLETVLDCVSAAGGGSHPSLSSASGGLVAAPLSPPRSLGPFSSSASSPSRPLVATRFHAVVVDGARALAFNLVSGALVQALVPGSGGIESGGDVFSAAAAATAAAAASAAAFDDGGDGDDDFAPPAHLLPPRPLAADAASGALYLVSAEGCLLEVAPTGDEGRDAWKAHLARGDFRAAAAAAADDAAARDAVSRAEAAHAFFQEGDLPRAARLYGRTLSAGSPTFEEVALRFMDSGDRAALMLLLGSRLEALSLLQRRGQRRGGGGTGGAGSPPDTTAQSAALAAWLAELHLDACNREELVSEAAAGAASAGRGSSEEEEGGSSSSTSPPALTPAQAALRAFLESHAGSLDVGVAVGLLAGYGRVDDLLFYARLRGDTEAVVEHLLAASAVSSSASASAARDDERRGGGGDASAAAAKTAAARAAVGALRAPGVPRELQYKFAPALFDLCPAEAVDAWLRADPPLAPSKLLPALSHAVDGGGGGGGKGPHSSSSEAISSSSDEARAAALRYVLTVLDGGGGAGGGEGFDDDDDDDGDNEGYDGNDNDAAGLSALHNLAVSLLADPRAGGEDAEDALLDFLSRAGKRSRRRRRSGSRGSRGTASYDPCLALAAARRGRRRRAAVALLQELGEIEAAVEEALEFDPALAAALAAAAPVTPAGDGGSSLLSASAAAAAAMPGSSSSAAAGGARRRAALSVARALISRADPRDPSAAVDAVDGFLRACAEAAAGGGKAAAAAAAPASSLSSSSSSSAATCSASAALLSLEDVLPLFPDTTCLGALKPAVLRSLDEADARARAARARARAAAEAADAARRDLRALRGRRGTVSAAAPCARCGRAVGGPPPPTNPFSSSSSGSGGSGTGGGPSLISRVYLYPTGNAYHGGCAVEALAEALPAREAAALRRRAADAAAGRKTKTPSSSSPSSSSGGGGGSHRSVDEELRAEDPCCGERAVASLGVPLVDPAEDAEALALWRVA